MRRAGKALLVAAVVTTLGVAGTVYAYAGGWTLTGNSATFTAKVAKMPRGVEPSVAKQSDRAVVTWSAQEIAPGVRMDHYVVTAHSENDPPRPDVTHTVAAGGGSAESLTFTTAEVAGGRWRWTIAPRYQGWTGAESPKSRRLVFPAAPAAPSAAKSGSTSPAAPADTQIAPSPAPVVTTSPPAQPAPPATRTPPVEKPEVEPPAAGESSPAADESVAPDVAPPGVD